MHASNAAIMDTFLVNMAIVLLLGFIAWRRIRNLKDYILGGCRLNMSTRISTGTAVIAGIAPTNRYCANLKEVSGIHSQAISNPTNLDGRLECPCPCIGSQINLR